MKIQRRRPRVITPEQKEKYRQRQNTWWKNATAEQKAERARLQKEKRNTIPSYIESLRRYRRSESFRKVQERHKEKQRQQLAETRKKQGLKLIGRLWVAENRHDTELWRALWRLGMSYQELSDLSGVQYTTVANAATGKKKQGKDVKARLIQALAKLGEIVSFEKPEDHEQEIQEAFITWQTQRPETEDPLTSITRAELAHAVGWALSKLSEKQRKVLIGLYFKGKTAGELSRELNCCRGSIYMTENDALRKLRQRAVMRRLQDLV